ncbi:MAG: RNA-binding protein [Gammaproteobacteria bacterium]|nr:RNA-binding protein [Gammaproteobacteria bacterium]NBT43545.1 RNA-binding protein [Gammaproteobacteria bacterium]NBY23341.1 RNA-binding protein [Gammaproteobacteria bacterium]NDE35474.1 RNA-binding protein [Gammaproteobacteria bacterium]NDE57455.1 RNA-binding protein [Gammaproteobacteria bacterium]
MASISTDRHPSSMRLDKWLWAARFFKTRQLAIEAIDGGKVHVNGHRGKPSKDITIGTQLTITKEPYSFHITVTGLNLQRRPADEATKLYEESTESHEKRQLEVARRREQRDLGIPLDVRPNKRDRRLIHRFKRIED